MYGGVIGMTKKIVHKLHQKKVQKNYGSKSYPDAELTKEQKNTKFPKDITFSILVPLYNTPEKFLIEMIESVQAQTYQKWELCLADGSDQEHSYVGEICKRMAGEDARIKYKK